MPFDNTQLKTLTFQKRAFTNRMNAALMAEKNIFKRTPKVEKPSNQSEYTKRRKESLFARQVDKLSDEKFMLLAEVLMDDELVLAIKTFATAPFNTIQYRVMVERIEKMIE